MHIVCRLLLVKSILMTIYLFYALLRPEKF